MARKNTRPLPTVTINKAGSSVLVNKRDLAKYKAEGWSEGSAPAKPKPRPKPAPAPQTKQAEAFSGEAKKG